MTQERISDEKRAKVRKQDATRTPVKRHAGDMRQVSGLAVLQQRVGNRAVQRLLAQRSGDGELELDDATADRINQARGGGHSLDRTVQEQMGGTMGHDFSGVRVHTSSESDALNRQLSAKAFTTGQDVFFRQGTYNPNSSSGQELIAHELTHVVQQSAGRVGGGERMTVRPPGDAYEQEADSVAQAVASAGVQVQRQAEEEEEEVQTKAIQRQDIPEEEEVQAKAIQRQAEEEEELVQAKAIQRQDVPEEEEVQAKAIQRQAEEEEETIQAKAIQRQDVPEEEELQTKAVQRQDEIPEKEL
jgi:hypothetical protein